jgi:hypothetical protein
MYFSLCGYRMPLTPAAAHPAQRHLKASGMTEGQQQQQEKTQYARCQRVRKRLDDRARKSMSRNCRTPHGCLFIGASFHMAFRGGIYDGAASVYFEALPLRLLQLVEQRSRNLAPAQR